MAAPLYPRPFPQLPRTRGVLLLVRLPYPARDPSPRVKRAGPPRPSSPSLPVPAGDTAIIA